MAAARDVTREEGSFYGRVVMQTRAVGATGDGRVQVRMASSTCRTLAREREDIRDELRAAGRMAQAVLAGPLRDQIGGADIVLDEAIPVGEFSVIAR